MESVSARTAEWQPLSSRLDAVGHTAPDTASALQLLVRLAIDGLPRMRLASAPLFVHSMRRDESLATVRAVGRSLRYTFMVLLGVNGLATSQQRHLLGGRTAAEWATETMRRHTVGGLGDAGLQAWMAAELGVDTRGALRDVWRWISRLDDAPNVEVAWALTGLCALMQRGAPVAREIDSVRARLLRAHHAGSGLFAPVRGGRLRGFRDHVGSFADQVYPIQALARHHVVTGDPASLAIAEATASRICALQGREGQWWWHYDVRTGQVVERYPVYSVHQDAMAPMALFDLAEAGGTDRGAAIRKGVEWLADPAETWRPLIDVDAGLIWRKVARGDPAKVVRSVRAVHTRVRPRVRPRTRATLIERWFPPGVVDYETRPYHLGWLLYAWLGQA
jgi:hypothetical protein